MKGHPRAAIDYALLKGGYFVQGGNSSHCFARLKCGIPEYRDHMMSIWSTPRDPRRHGATAPRQTDYPAGGALRAC